jgi:hypothetical protein
VTVDFFVSYTQADRAWAEWIAWGLEEDGYQVLVQAWDFVSGSNWIQGMHDGVSSATRTIAVLSPDYLESVYGKAEWQAAWAADPSGQDRKLLVVRVRETERPGLLAGVVGVDVFDVPEEKARERVRAMVRRAIAGRSKPDTPPSFPSAARAMPHQARFPSTLPAIWNVPARNPHFAGRSGDLAALREKLSSGPATVQAVRGMGGVGKTHLAVEYAHRHCGDYEVVWCVGAEEPALLTDQFASLATKLGLDATADPEQLRAAVHDALRQLPRWLLVFDNADAAEDIQPWIPSGSTGHVLVTTRRGGFSALGQVHDLDVIDPLSAAQILRARVPALAEDVALRIAEEFDRLPLALEQAAAFLDRTGLSGTDYLELLRTRADELYQRGRSGTTIATLWDLSFERVLAENPASMQLLEVCAYLAAEPIPLDLFTAHPDKLPEPLSTATRDPLSFIETVAVIVDYSLGKRMPDGLQLHRLVQAALRRRQTAS